MIFTVFPQFTHIFECLAFGLGDEFPYEDGGYDTDDAVKGVSKHVSEFVAHIAYAHVIHGNESRRYDEVEYPLECNGNGNGGSTYGVGEDFGDKHPAYWSPREHK